MSSSLTTLVPVLTGPNYQTWAPAMKSFLMLQGQWHILSCPCPYDITLDKDGNCLEMDKLPSDKKIKENQEKIEDWEETNSKAVGNITLCLSPAIQGNYTDPSMESAGIFWAALETAYGKPGVIVTYLKFQAAIETRMSDHEDPSLCIDKMITHLTHVMSLFLSFGNDFGLGSYFSNFFNLYSSSKIGHDPPCSHDLCLFLFICFHFTQSHGQEKSLLYYDLFDFRVLLYGRTPTLIYIFLFYTTTPILTINIFIVRWSTSC